MKKSLKGAVIGSMALAAGPALAGGLDRSGQGVGVLFEKGNVVEMSIGQVAPSVSGVLGVASGDIAPDYMSIGIAMKKDINEKLSFAVIMDQPFGAAVDYTVVPAYPLPDVTAELKSLSLTALVRYKFSDRFSVHGGLRYVTMSGETFTTPPGTMNFAGSSDLAMVAGAAFEIPDIALRAALTYSSATEHGHTSDLLLAPNTPAFTIPTYTMPQSVNLDFQTGIAANTLLFGSIRWVDWTSTAITTPVGSIDYDEDSLTYALGVGRKFSDSFSGAISLGYEAATGAPASNLSPTDGNFSVGLGGTYTNGNMKITAGVRQVWLGDATTEIVGAQFSDNTAFGAGVKVSFSF